MNTAAQRLAALRQTMQQQQFDAWLIPSADPHLSEYLPEHWQGRSWLSGFDGSVGTLLITAERAELWADSRYWEQAERQLAGSGIVLQKLGLGRSHLDSVAELPAGALLGVAPDMLSLAAKRQLESTGAAKNIRLRHDLDLLDSVWPDRPGLPAAPVYRHGEAFTAESAAAKLIRVRRFMQEQQAQHHLISSLDDIAWLTNLRGSDVSYNPVFLAYLLISAEQAVLFADPAKFDGDARQALAEAGITLADYDSVADAVAALSGSLLIDPAKTAVSTLNRLPESVVLRESINPSTLFKSCKSAAEIAHTREAMKQDGIALCGFFAEFEQALAEGRTLTELDIDRMLLEHRRRRPHFISPSFGTIAGFNANGALPHYSATPEAHSTLSGDGLLLIDSGGQYRNGTTDITRVVPVGTPSAEHKRDFTLVLKAHIALAETEFPENIAAPMLDAVCRKPMWQAQCDYGHGTGHGVGYFLNVHEGPQVLSYHAPVTPHSAMKAGMITSIEPGLYRPGRWGIRIENLVVNLPVTQPTETQFGRFLRFDTLTLCPIDTRLMDTALMSRSEIDWVNRYHAQVREQLAPHTEGAAKAWLEQRTRPLA